MIAYEWYNFYNKSTFIAKVKEIASRLDVPASWLMIVMEMESGIRAKSKCPNGYAYGLFQWTKIRLKDLGVTYPELRAMNSIQQLDLAYRTFKPYIRKVNNLYDLYFVIFFPEGLGKRDNYVLATKGQKGFRGLAYEWNKTIDTKFGNHDGKLTVADVKAFVNSKIPDGYSPYRDEINED